jgi:translocation and assembly module TamA
MRILPNWSLAAFFDVGNAFNEWDDTDLKRGVGVGIRWYTIAGAIRVDFAKGLDLVDKPWRIHFTIGTSLL